MLKGKLFKKWNKWVCGGILLVAIGFLFGLGAFYLYDSNFTKKEIEFVQIPAKGKSIKVSVIVPVYNTAPYLERCLNSAINQTLKDIEIICVNDGSTDNSLEILQKYAKKDKRIKVVDLKTNRGVSNARNIGISVAQGEFIGFLDSDDFIDPGWYENLYNQSEGYDFIRGVRLIDGWYLPGKPYNRLTASIVRKNFVMDQKIFFKDEPHEDVPYAKKVIKQGGRKKDAKDNGQYYHYEKRAGSLTNPKPEDIKRKGKGWIAPPKLSVEKVKINNTQIPKVIHYVWLGSKELPEAVKQNVETWKKYHPDYKIKRWDENNCDIDSNPGAKKYYKRGKYNLASDYCKAKALLEGGIYLDTDMVLKNRVDPLLNEPLVLTLQLKDVLSASFMAVRANHPFVQSIVKEYEQVGDWTKRAPQVWNENFKKIFSINFISIGQKKGEYNIIAPNILMYDFNGGENVAEHLFWDNTKGQKSKFYDEYRKRFLRDFATYDASKKGYFIFKNEKDGYFYDPEKESSQIPAKGKSIKVSVIIPIYNTAPYLERCLNSAINQTLKDIEIICVNDGSTDNSLEILNKYAQKDKRIKIVDLKQNRGAANARNVGISVAQGEFIGFLDSDDFVDEKLFENLYKNSKGFDSVKAMMLECEVINPKWQHASIAGSIVSRQFLTNHNIEFPLNKKVGEDLEFSKIIQKYGRVKLLEDNGIYYHYEFRAGSLMNFSKKTLEKCKANINKKVN